MKKETKTVYTFEVGDLFIWIKPPEDWGYIKDDLMRLKNFNKEVIRFDSRLSEPDRFALSDIDDIIEQLELGNLKYIPL